MRCRRDLSYLLAVYIIGYLLNKCRNVATQPTRHIPRKAIPTFFRERENLLFLFPLFVSLSPLNLSITKKDWKIAYVLWYSYQIRWPARFVRVFHIYSRTCCRPFRIAKKDCNPPRQYGGNIARTCVIQLRRFQFQIRIRPIPVFHRLWIHYARNVTIEFFPFPLTDAHDALLPAAYLSYRIKTTNSSPPPSRFVLVVYFERAVFPKMNSSAVSLYRCRYQ